MTYYRFVVSFTFIDDDSEAVHKIYIERIYAVYALLS